MELMKRVFVVLLYFSDCMMFGSLKILRLLERMVLEFFVILKEFFLSLVWVFCVVVVSSLVGVSFLIL